MAMTLDEVRLSICYLLWHYRPALLPEFHEITKSPYTIGHMADFLDRHFPLEGQSWGTHTIVLTPSELLHYIEQETMNAAANEDLLRSPYELVQHTGRTTGCEGDQP